MGWNLPEQVRLQALSGCNRGAAAEAHAIGEMLNFGEEQPKRTQASGEQQLKRTETGNLTAVTKRIDAIREQQLKRTQSMSSSSVQRAIRHRITHVGDRANEGEEAELCTL